MVQTHYKNIFLVDDDEDEHIILTDVLSEIDKTIKLVIVENGKLAYDYLTAGSRNLPELIFCDLNMPVCGGVDLLKNLKRNEVLSKIPVVMYSTSFLDNQPDEMKRLGAAHCLVKSSGYVELENEVRSLLLKVL